LAGLKKTIIRTGLETLYFSGLHHLMRPLVGGVGAILTLHHVRPARSDAFQPNRLLEVTPIFLEGLLKRLSRARIDVVSLDEMYRRFVAGDYKRRFVCITFDDGYADVSDPSQILMGRLNRIYGIAGKVDPNRTYNGRFGFIME